MDYINETDLILCISEAVDLVNPMVYHHQHFTAYMALQISAALGLNEDDQAVITYAAALHDIGALSLDTRIQSLDFDFNDSGHAELGYSLLKTYKPFLAIANNVLYHHTAWNRGKAVGLHGEPIPQGSHILHLADRIAVLAAGRENLRGAAPDIRQKIFLSSGTSFSPQLVEVFMNISESDAFWAKIEETSLDRLIRESLPKKEYPIDDENLIGLTRFFGRLIDFRSPYTVTHSSGVAAIAEALSRLMGFSKEDSVRMRIAGYLHDLGKLAIPTELLEKKGPLSADEYKLVRMHAYYTNQILLKVRSFDQIRKWAALHHERLDGKGYPFYLGANDLSTGSRIMSVADVFVAISEDRPYRAGMRQEQAADVLQHMVKTRALDPGITGMLLENYDMLNAVRNRAQKQARDEYRKLHEQRESLSF